MLIIITGMYFSHFIAVHASFCWGDFQDSDLLLFSPEASIRKEYFLRGDFMRVLRVTEKLKVWWSDSEFHFFYLLASKYEEEFSIKDLTATNSFNSSCPLWQKKVFEPLFFIQSASAQSISTDSSLSSSMLLASRM